MESLLTEIEHEIQKIYSNGLLLWLKADDGLTAESKLRKLASCFLYFPMAFSDINKLTLMYPEDEAKSDALKLIINNHCAEDGTHWVLFLKDLETMRLNHTVEWTSALKVLFGERLTAQRVAHYDSIKLCHRAQEPVHRYCLIYAYERVTGAFLSATVELSNQFETETGKRIHYFGQTHLDLEGQHVHCGSDEYEFKRTLADNMVTVTELEAEQVLDIVKETIRINQNHLNGCLESIKREYNLN